MTMPPDTCCNLATEASQWVQQWLKKHQQERDDGSPKSLSLLDWAAGSGRHASFGAKLGYLVLALDQQIPVGQATEQSSSVKFVRADLELGPWPLAFDQQFDAIIVCNYLFRPRLSLLAHHLAEGGLFIYETFAVGNEEFGRPSNPKFLLQAGELLRFCEVQRWHVLAYEDGVVQSPKPARVQRVAAIRPRQLPAVTNAGLSAISALAL